MEDCIFCKIIRGEIPAKKEYETDSIFVFHDITPQAPIHLLIIPKAHIKSMNEIDSLDPKVIHQIFEVIPELAKKNGIFEKGYRVVNNCGTYGGQTVGHLHFHLLGGRHLQWPPG